MPGGRKHAITFQDMDGDMLHVDWIRNGNHVSVFGTSQGRAAGVWLSTAQARQLAGHLMLLCDVVEAEREVATQ